VSGFRPSALGFRSDERAVVTGIGTISPLGVGKDALLVAMGAMRQGSRPATESRKPKAEGPSPLGPFGLICNDFQPRTFIDPMVLRRLDRGSALAVAAGRLAVEDAGLEVAPIADRVGVVAGTGASGMETTGAFSRVLCAQGPAAANPSLFPNTVPNAPVGHLAIALGARGPSTTLAQKGTAGEAALALAADLVLLGRADAVLAGGVDELSECLHHGYLRFGALSASGAARPFDVHRDGLLLGEGATFLVVEREDRARARGARVYGVLAGSASANAPAPPTAYPADPRPLARCYARALEAARLAPDAIGWVSACANGTRPLDGLEAVALGLALRDAPAGTPVSSLKGALGDGMAGGATRAAAGLLALEAGLIPATAGLLTPSAIIEAALGPLALVRGEAREARIDAVLQTAVGDAGGIAAIVLARA
jgi:3-oxoacyl-[acyl-carrier-protein] synthase II